MQEFPAETGALLLGVFDGHGSQGHSISGTLTELLPDMLATSDAWKVLSPDTLLLLLLLMCGQSPVLQNPTKSSRFCQWWHACLQSKHFTAALAEQIPVCNAVISHHSSGIDCSLSGSTAVVACIQPDRKYAHASRLAHYERDSCQRMLVRHLWQCAQ